MKKRTLVKPEAREQMKADPGRHSRTSSRSSASSPGVTQSAQTVAIVFPPPEIWSEQCILRQRIYASLSATMVVALLTFLCYGPLPAASNESSSLPVQGRPRGRRNPQNAPPLQRRQRSRARLKTTCTAGSRETGIAEGRATTLHSSGPTRRDSEPGCPCRATAPGRADQRVAPWRGNHAPRRQGRSGAGPGSASAL